MRQVGEALAELADARLDELLALLGHVVLGVLAEVAEGGGLLDFFRKFMDQLVFKRVDLFLQFSFDLLCHGLQPTCRIIPLSSGRDGPDAR